ncbi:acetate--CoA ligase family protein [Nocardioides endophyticus]|uniref:Acetate--CoA ligase family protein n=1 Tax=Nocardioides endophyticus TaxID=1353775 RepID=A0ABP8YEQ0_9ACTN
MRLEGEALVELLASPKSVAVIGASADRTRLSGRPLDYLSRLGYSGALYAVNARSDLPGVPTVRGVSELPAGEVDVALVALPAAAAVQALRDAERVGVRAAVVIGSGFEDRGAQARQELDEFVAGSAMRVIGPNCVGTLGVPAASYLTFSSVLQNEIPLPGRVGLVTQSGALGNSLLQTLIRRHVGLHQWFSTGNEVDTGAVELTTGLLALDEVEAVGVFLEGVTDPAWLGRLDEAIRRTAKPLFVLKAAQSDSGRRAAAGHTGRIVGSSDAADAILREMGARLVSSIAELADALVLAGVGSKLAGSPRPRVSVVSVSGAAGVIGADRVAQDGRLRMAEPGRGVPLDPRLHFANPLDVPFIGETEVFTDTLVAVASGSDSEVVIGVESSLAHEREELVAKVSTAATHQPIVLTSLSEDDQIPVALTLELSRAGIAYLPTVERAVAAVAAVAAQETPEDDDGAPHPPVDGDGDAGELRGLEWIAQALPAGLPWARSRVLDKPMDHAAGERAAAELGLPLVVKAAGRTIEHRTELGAVRVVRDPRELAEALPVVGEICTRHGDALMLQGFAAPGFEVLLSVLDDPEFGPVAFVRPGGTLAELLSGQTAIWHGWDADRRVDVLRRSRIGKLLAAYRGGPTYDVVRLAELVGDCLDAVGRDGLQFLEMNPVIVHERGLTLIDAVGRSAVVTHPERTP